MNQAKPSTERRLSDTQKRQEKVTYELWIKKKAEEIKKLKELEAKEKRKQQLLANRERVKKLANESRSKAVLDQRVRIPPDLRVGDVVLAARGVGIVRYMGPIHAIDDSTTFLGIELKGAKGIHDGVLKNKRYFKCPKNRGVFVKGIKKILTPAELIQKLGKIDSDKRRLAIHVDIQNNQLSFLRQENSELRLQMKALQDHIAKMADNDTEIISNMGISPRSSMRSQSNTPSMGPQKTPGLIDNTVSEPLQPSSKVSIDPKARYSTPQLTTMRKGDSYPMGTVVPTKASGRRPRAFSETASDILGIKSPPIPEDDVADNSQLIAAPWSVGKSQDEEVFQGGDDVFQRGSLGRGNNLRQERSDSVSTWDTAISGGSWMESFMQQHEDEFKDGDDPNELENVSSDNLGNVKEIFENRGSLRQNDSDPDEPVTVATSETV